MPIEMYEKDKLVEFIYKSKLRYITNNPNDFDFNLFICFSRSNQRGQSNKLKGSVPFN